MLYRLFSLQTNLHISLNYQSDIFHHNSTNYEELLLSSDILAGVFFHMQKLIWCSGVPEIYGGLGVRGTSAMGICAFFSK